MKIHAITVCVNYADYLSRSIDRWKRGTDSLIVVTKPSDDETIGLCRSHDVTVHQTEVFTARGAVFNKAAAINEAIGGMQSDWALLFDSDILPPVDWRTIVEMAEPQPGNLYGAPRHHEDGRMIPDSELAGYFQLFHSTDPNAQRRPLLDEGWRSAGGYDTEFQLRWRRLGKDRRKRLNLPLIHLGDISTNWWGRGRKDLMDEMFRERRRRGNYSFERIA